MEARSRSQHTAFHCAAREGHLKVVQFLLQQVRKDWGKYPGRTVGLWNSDWKVWCGGHTCFQILVSSCIWLSTYNNSGFHMFSLHITTLTYDLSYIKAMFQFTWVSLHRVFERLDPNWTSRPHIPSTSFLAFFCGFVALSNGGPILAFSNVPWMADPTQIARCPTKRACWRSRDRQRCIWHLPGTRREPWEGTVEV